MGDAAEVFREMKRRSAIRRANNRKNSAQMLLERGVKFETKNNGGHLIVHGPESVIDFWPGTGRWHDRTGGRGFGVRHLLQHIGIKG